MEKNILIQYQMTKPHKLLALRKKCDKGINISCITAYDASISKFLDSMGVDLILVGDSLGQVIQGKSSTHKVSLSDIIYHSKCVQAGITNSVLMVDLPKDTYNTKTQALKNCKTILKDCKADLIKIEVSNKNIDIASYLTKKDIPVCAHIGLLPQSIFKKSGYRKYGKSSKESSLLFDLAMSLDDLGVQLILLECIEENLAHQISTSVRTPVIGIGSGTNLDGQVAVIYDLLGVSFNTVSSLIMIIIVLCKI